MGMRAQNVTGHWLLLEEVLGDQTFVSYADLMANSCIYGVLLHQADFSRIAWPSNSDVVYVIDGRKVKLFSFWLCPRDLATRAWLE